MLMGSYAGRDEMHVGDDGDDTARGARSRAGGKGEEAMKMFTLGFCISLTAGIACSGPRADTNEGAHQATDTPIAWSDSNRLLFRRVLKSFDGDIATTGCALTGVYQVVSHGSSIEEDTVVVGQRICDAIWQEPQPSVDPLGRMLVYTHFGPQGDIVTLDLTESRPTTTVTRSCSPPTSFPTWSPNGEMIAFGSICDRSDENSVIRVTMADGSRVWTVGGIEDSGSNSHPSWSPDSRQIAFAHRRGADNQIAITDTVGKIVRILGSGGGAPFWSPDGGWIAFLDRVKPSDKSPSLFIIRPDGSDRRLLLNANDTRLGGTEKAWLRGPLAWAPGGRAIAFTRGDVIWVLFLDPEVLYQLTQAPR